MSFSYTTSATEAFTVTHARKMASKVATDLKRIQRFYYAPSDPQINSYEQEVIELLKRGFLGTVTYGFKRNGQWVEPTLRYTARDLEGVHANDDDPGRIRPRADTNGASFYSYLTYSAAWDRLSASEKYEFEKCLPFNRNGANEPGVDGYLINDKVYSSGGRALERACVRTY